MSTNAATKQPIILKRRLARAAFAIGALAFGALGALPVQAQMPARFYWKSLSGGNAAALLVESMSGNTNPFNPALTVEPGANLDGTVAIMAFAHSFTLFDRSATAAIIAPMGRVSGELDVAGKIVSQSSSGFANPMLEFDINLIGPKAQKSIPDAMRYEPGFSVDVLADLAFPIGKYDATQSLNIGQNRWYGRVGLPIVWQIGSWVPGRRTTLEVLPVVWLFGDNNDYLGQKLSTDPLFQIDGHLTRDFTDSLWGAVDGSYYNGAKSTINGVSTQPLDNFGVGLTLGYRLNDNLGLTFGYKTTVNDSAPDALRFDNFMFTLVYGWHPLVEGSKRLQGEK